MEQKSFFSATKEKVYITAVFVVLRYILGYLAHANVQARFPMLVNLFIGAVDVIVSLPLKIFSATPLLKSYLKLEATYLILFIVFIAYWYLFACILVYAYDTLNKADSEEKKDDVQKTSGVL